MRIRIPLAQIEAAWPSGLYDLFTGLCVRLEPTDRPQDIGSIRFTRPCAYGWDEETGDLLIEQPDSE